MADTGGISGGPVEQSGPVGPTASEAAQGSTIQDKRFWNTLSKSQQEDVMQLLLAYASQPVLISPILIPDGAIDTSIKGAVSSVEVQLSQIGNEVWQGYLQNLNAISDQVAETIKSSQYQQKVEASNPLSVKRVLDNNEGIISGVTDYVDKHKNDANSTAFMSMAFVVAAGMIGNAINVVNVASTPMVAVTPVVDAAQVASQVAPAALADSAAMTINLFLPAMLYSTTLAAANAANTGKGEKEIDLDFARNYAKTILAKVGGNEINQFLGALVVNKFDAGEPITQEQLAQASNTTKLVMLSVAFALFYKVETGWLTGSEFANFIQNNPYKQGTVEYNIINTIQQYISLIPPDDRAATIEQLMAYCDKNPSVEELLNPEKAFSNVISGVNREIDAA